MVNWSIRRLVNGSIGKLVVGKDAARQQSRTHSSAAHSNAGGQLNRTGGLRMLTLVKLTSTLVKLTSMLIESIGRVARFVVLRTKRHLIAERITQTVDTFRSASDVACNIVWNYRQRSGEGGVDPPVS